MAREGASSQLIQVGAYVAARAGSVRGVEPWTVTDTGNRMIFRLCVEFRPLSCLARFFSCLSLPNPPMSLRLGGRCAPPSRSCGLTRWCRRILPRGWRLWLTLSDIWIRDCPAPRQETTASIWGPDPTLLTWPSFTPDLNQLPFQGLPA